MFGNAATKVQESVRILMPKVRTTALLAGLTILAIGCGLAWLVLNPPSFFADDQDPAALAFGSVLLGSVPVGFVYRLMRQRQESLILPAVAQALGMTYAKSGLAVLNGMPPQLLPRGRVDAEDHIQARVADRLVELAELRIRPSNDRHHTLFSGIVLHIPDGGATAPFLLAPVHVARPGIAFGNFLSTDGYRHLRDFDLAGAKFGLWIAALGGGESPALTARIDALVAALTPFARDWPPHSIASDGKGTWLALTHHRDLFRLGGVLPTEPRILEAVQNAVADLSAPLALAQAVIEAQAAGEKS
ncbi:hypothetical protein [Tabrizicola aquatica]|uniref:hypothetical protein n=1 Tax=Tabrizicola aquatica TaxID=909926 RepID=UPI000CD02C41|nr:hypothetical protein [Tabrizicola aquatica]